MPVGNDQLNIRCDKELKAAFITQAKRDGTTATDLIVNFMRQYLGMETEDIGDRAPRPASAIPAAEIEELIDSRLEARLASLRLDARLAEIEGKLAA